MPLDFRFFGGGVEFVGRETVVRPVAVPRRGTDGAVGVVRRGVRQRVVGSVVGDQARRTHGVRVGDVVRELQERVALLLQVLVVVGLAQPLPGAPVGDVPERVMDPPLELLLRLGGLVLVAAGCHETPQLGGGVRRRYPVEEPPARIRVGAAGAGRGGPLRIAHHRAVGVPDRPERPRSQVVQPGSAVRAGRHRHVPPGPAEVVVPDPLPRLDRQRGDAVAVHLPFRGAGQHHHIGDLAPDASRDVPRGPAAVLQRGTVARGEVGPAPVGDRDRHHLVSAVLLPRHHLADLRQPPVHRRPQPQPGALEVQLGERPAVRRPQTGGLGRPDAPAGGGPGRRRLTGPGEALDLLLGQGRPLPQQPLDHITTGGIHRRVRCRRRRLRLRNRLTRPGETLDLLLAEGRPLPQQPLDGITTGTVHRRVRLHRLHRGGGRRGGNLPSPGLDPVRKTRRDQAQQLPCGDRLMAGAVPQLLLQFGESLPLVLVQPRFQHPAQFLVGGARLGPVEVLLSRVGHRALTGGVTGKHGQPAVVARDQGLAVRVESQPVPEPLRGLAEHRRQRQVKGQVRPAGRGELPGDEGAQALPGQRPLLALLAAPLLQCREAAQQRQERLPVVLQIRPVDQAERPHPEQHVVRTPHVARQVRRQAVPLRECRLGPEAHPPVALRQLEPGTEAAGRIGGGDDRLAPAGGGPHPPVPVAGQHLSRQRRPQRIARGLTRDIRTRDDQRGIRRQPGLVRIGGEQVVDHLRVVDRLDGPVRQRERGVGGVAAQAQQIRLPERQRHGAALGHHPCPVVQPHLRVPVHLGQQVIGLGPSGQVAGRTRGEAHRLALGVQMPHLVHLVHRHPGPVHGHHLRPPVLRREVVRRGLRQQRESLQRRVHQRLELPPLGRGQLAGLLHRRGHERLELLVDPVGDRDAHRVAAHRLGHGLDLRQFRHDDHRVGEYLRARRHQRSDSPHRRVVHDAPDGLAQHLQGEGRGVPHRALVGLRGDVRQLPDDPLDLLGGQEGHPRVEGALRLEEIVQEPDVPQLLDRQGHGRSIGVQRRELGDVHRLRLAGGPAVRGAPGQSGDQVLTRSRRVAGGGGEEPGRNRQPAHALDLLPQEPLKHRVSMVGDLAVGLVEEVPGPRPQPRQDAAERLPQCRDQQVLEDAVRRVIRAALPLDGVRHPLHRPHRAHRDMAERLPRVSPHLVDVRDGRQERGERHRDLGPHDRARQLRGDPLPVPPRVDVRGQVVGPRQPAQGVVLERSHAEQRRAHVGLHVGETVRPEDAGQDRDVVGERGGLPPGQARDDLTEPYRGPLVVGTSQRGPRPQELGLRLGRGQPPLPRQRVHRRDDELRDREGEYGLFRHIGGDVFGNRVEQSRLRTAPEPHRVVDDVDTRALGQHRLLGEDQAGGKVGEDQHVPVLDLQADLVAERLRGVGGRPRRVPVHRFLLHGGTPGGQRGDEERGAAVRPLQGVDPRGLVPPGRRHRHTGRQHMHADAAQPVADAPRHQLKPGRIRTGKTGRQDQVRRLLREPRPGQRHEPARIEPRRPVTRRRPPEPRAITVRPPEHRLRIRAERQPAPHTDPPAVHKRPLRVLPHPADIPVRGPPQSGLCTRERHQPRKPPVPARDLLDHHLRERCPQARFRSCLFLLAAVVLLSRDLRRAARDEPHHVTRPGPRHLHRPQHLERPAVTVRAQLRIAFVRHGGGSGGTAGPGSGRYGIPRRPGAGRTDAAVAVADRQPGLLCGAGLRCPDDEGTRRFVRRRRGVDDPPVRPGVGGAGAGVDVHGVGVRLRGRVLGGQRGSVGFPVGVDVHRLGLPGVEDDGLVLAVRVVHDAACGDTGVRPPREDRLPRSGTVRGERHITRRRCLDPHQDPVLPGTGLAQPVPHRRHVQPRDMELSDRHRVQRAGQARAESPGGEIARVHRRGGLWQFRQRLGQQPHVVVQVRAHRAGQGFGQAHHLFADLAEPLVGRVGDPADLRGECAEAGVLREQEGEVQGAVRHRLVDEAADLLGEPVLVRRRGEPGAQQPVVGAVAGQAERDQMRGQQRSGAVLRRPDDARQALGQPEAGHRPRGRAGQVQLVVRRLPGRPVRVGQLLDGGTGQVPEGVLER